MWNSLAKNIGNVILRARDNSSLENLPPAIRFRVLEVQVGTKIFSGILLTDYRDPILVVNTKKSRKLNIYSYDLSLPPNEPYIDVYTVSQDINKIELKGYGNSIVSFKLLEDYF